MRRIVLTTASVLLFTMLGPLSGPARAGHRAAVAAGTARADFNGDGLSDLAVSASAEDVGNLASAGAVNVIYGSAIGLASPGNQFWTQASPGLPTAPEVAGRFGAALAAGDFNGDVFTDLAVGAPGADVEGVSNAGAVVVLYGTANGLTSSGSQVFDQSGSRMQGDPETNDTFGIQLAAGNFGRTQEDDLAIGVGGDKVDAVSGAGAVQVVYGSLTGLSPNGNQLWSENSPGMAGDGAQADDAFGGMFGQSSGMAAGDLGKDGHADLAIGVPQEDIGALQNAGAVLVLYGGSGGLSTAGSQFWTQDSAGVLDDSESNDLFGSSVAAADFGRSSTWDLAIGASNEGLLTKIGCGGVNVLYGTPGGLTATNSRFFSQDTTSVKDQCEDQGTTNTGDAFGFSLSAADFGKSAQADLAVGAPGEDLGTAHDAGVVHVLYGTATGLSTVGNQLWSQNSTGIAETSEGPAGIDDSPDLFGFALLAANFGKSVQADLAVGSVGEDLVGNTLTDAGAVNALYGTSSGIAAAGDQLWTQDSTGIKDQAEQGDEFGFALAGGPDG